MMKTLGGGLCLATLALLLLGQGVGQTEAEAFAMPAMAPGSFAGKTPDDRDHIFASANDPAGPISISDVGQWWRDSDVGQGHRFRGAFAAHGEDARVCHVCSSAEIKQGVAADHQGGTWVAFFCRRCAPHLSVRGNAQVPVVWPSEDPRFNASARLVMLPLYKRCRKCRRFATFGPRARLRKNVHCKQHKEDGEVDVTHRRRCQAEEGCALRPSFSTPGDSHGRFCTFHKAEHHVDVIHTLKCRWRGKDRKERCTRKPLFGKKGGLERWCALHRLPSHVHTKEMRCSHEGCWETPSFGRWEDGGSIFCMDHKRPGDVDIVSHVFQSEQSKEYISARQRQKMEQHTRQKDAPAEHSEHLGMGCSTGEHPDAGGGLAPPAQHEEMGAGNGAPSLLGALRPTAAV